MRNFNAEGIKSFSRLQYVLILIGSFELFLSYSRGWVGLGSVKLKEKFGENKVLFPIFVAVKLFYFEI